MTSRISNDIKRSFGLASLQREAAKILTDKEWKTLQAIKQKYADQVKFEKRAFELEYDTRVEVVRRRLINQAGSKTKELKPRWVGRDRFSKADTLRLAQRYVDNQFQQTLAHLEKSEIKEINALMERSEHRQVAREKPRKDFAKAVNRRAGQDRRKTDKQSIKHTRRRDR
ncbi:hypothetical protein [Maritalea sp.]|jgi:hypothetical protein|uniref:hypothetical protein n=1 Tax=Maritalea sp. TaxID=2003361 RepID=UPI0039E22A5B